MIALSELNLQLLGRLLVHLVVIIQLVEIVDKLLIVFNSEVGLKLLHILYLFLVAYQLLLHFTYDFVAAFIPLFNIRVSPMELLGLIAHIFEELLLDVEVAGCTLYVCDYFQVLRHWAEEPSILTVFLDDLH